ncbi:hypothetical protein MAPG_07016, partial [Magnaporthiopsis poae ATCC 64411]
QPAAAAAPSAQPQPPSQQQPAPAPAAAQPPQQQQQQQQQAQAQLNGSNNQQAPRPRDARTLELLLTAQGVTAFEPRVPLLLLDFAYRHTAAVLSDALHLSGDPYTTHAGAMPSASQGASATAPPGGDASVSASAVQVAIASRLAFSVPWRCRRRRRLFLLCRCRYKHKRRHGRKYPGREARRVGGGASKEFLLETARERNRAALLRILPSEWGAGIDDDDDDDDGDEDMSDAMEGVEGGGAGAARQGSDGPDEEVGGEPVEGGTIDDVFGDDVDEEMAEE